MGQSPKKKEFQMYFSLKKEKLVYIEDREKKERKY